MVVKITLEWEFSIFGSVFMKCTCAIVKYLPYEDTFSRTTLKKWLKHLDIWIEVNFYHMLNQVDERDLFLRTSQFEILLVCFLILFHHLLPAVQWISPLRSTGHYVNILGWFVWWFFRCCFRVCFTEVSSRGAMNVIAVGISLMNALILSVLIVIIKATLVRNVRTLQDVIFINPWFILALTHSEYSWVLPLSILL